jgi:ribosomal protein L24
MTFRPPGAPDPHRINIGDEVQVLHRGTPTGTIGTVLDVHQAGSGVTMLSVRLQSDDEDDPPAFDTADSFSKVQ